MNTLQDAAFGLLFFIAGFLDSIVGGGGLITVPSFTLMLGAGAHAIGTNKVTAVASTLMALVVYQRKGHLLLEKSVPFLIAILVGTVLGARTAPFVPDRAFHWGLLVICPIILWIIFHRDSLRFRFDLPIHNRRALLALLGLACGFYDGVFGPGAGTFMFLSLTWFAGLPLMQAIATSKLANFISAAGSLATYAAADEVHWKLGLKFAAFALVGAIVGAHLASQKAQRIVKPVLVIVILLLMIRLAHTL